MHKEEHLMEDLRTQGVEPGRRRLQLGLSSIIGREGGVVVEVFPDGTETVLFGPGAKEPASVDPRTDPDRLPSP